MMLGVFSSEVVSVIATQTAVDPLTFFFFGIYPYLCLVIFIGGSIWRYVRQPYGWKTDSSQILRTRAMTVASNLFHAGILLIFVGHLIGFFLPIEFFHLLGITPPLKQLLAIVLGGTAGAMCFVGLIMLLFRRVGESRVRKHSRIMDVVLLVWLLTVLSLGLSTIPTSLQHKDGSLIVQFMHYMQTTFTFQQGALVYIVGAPLLYKVHMVLSMSLFLIFPFTRLVHIWSGFAMLLTYPFRKRQLVRARPGSST